MLKIALHQIPANNNLSVSVHSHVIPMKKNFLPRHYEYLMRWLEVGSSMGLCDVDISPRFSANQEHDTIDYILIWVREKPDPAYMIKPIGTKWVVIDHLRNYQLGQYKNFEDALLRIRPLNISHKP
ncbi:hypothetical protein [Entomobacter blattae]|uniref:Uncharacterized protein n=1 Tax=Entomobacter blattae TaxID=2762277 RepID=A0A7H1NQH7_9PROT|nr:hypothetical protein [Entomobacter blattae]QNT78037.1 hypothetical protein JGUZn3_08040 [Entomobacter blattae]